MKHFIEYCSTEYEENVFWLYSVIFYRFCSINNSEIIDLYFNYKLHPIYSKGKSVKGLCNITKEEKRFAVIMYLAWIHKIKG